MWGVLKSLSMLGLRWIRDPRARYQNSNQCIVMSVVTEMGFILSYSEVSNSGIFYGDMPFFTFP